MERVMAVAEFARKDPTPIQKTKRLQLSSAEATGPAGDADAIRQAARQGMLTPTGALPYAEHVRKSFGSHDISQVQAHVGPAASASADAMGALAYATGNHVVFAGTPSLRTVAHEAAHVVQQRAGVQLIGGIGQVGDRYEQHADAVADRVVAGESAEALLGEMGGGRNTAQPATDSLIQGWFKIKGGNTYTDRADLDAAATKKRIDSSLLPNGTTAQDVVDKIGDWASDGANKGTHYWKDLIDAVIKAEFKKDMDLEEIMEPYTPTGVTSTLEDNEVWDWEGEFSQDFSDQFHTAYGQSTSDIRKQTMVLEHDETEAKGTTYGTGRFMSMTGKKVLGETRYEEFLPKLPKLTGLTKTEVAQAILDGLLDDDAFQATLSKLTSDGAEALTKTVRLMHNEILQRSSTNLISIVGATVRTIKDPSKDLGARYKAEGKFVPQGKDHKGIGGQQLSRMHHPGLQEDLLENLDSDLTKVWENNKKAWKSILGKFSSPDDLAGALSEKLIKVYIDNLQSAWSLTFK
jgi:hypothetical protein